MAIVSSLTLSNTPKTLTEIATEQHLSKASAYRILHSLEEQDWVECDSGTGKYRAGNKILEIGLAVLSNTTLRSISMPYLKDLLSASNETIGLYILAGKERVLIEGLQPDHELRLVSPVGKRVPLWYGSAGKAILANLKETQITEIINELKQSGSHKDASGRMLDTDALLRELALIRRRGYAISVDERNMGISGVATAIFSNENEVVGAVSIAGPSERFNEEAIKKYCTLVRDAAENITQRIGSTVIY